jgi:uncharacterized SAM-binding protein YcdF (DUF218 family)
MTTKLFAMGWALMGVSAVIVGLLALGMGLSFTRRKAIGYRLMQIAAMIVIAGTFLPLDRWALRPLEDRFPQLTQFPAHVDGIIVLGGLAEPAPNGTIGLNEAAERLTSFAALAHAYPQARLVFTGTSPADPTRMTEGEAVRHTLKDMGIDTSRMQLEPKSWDTYENAAFSYALVKPQPGETWILVTSASHMPRAVGVFRHIGWNVIPCPTGYKSYARFHISFDDHLQHLDLAAHEWLGLAIYRLEGRTDTLFPGPQSD